MSTSIKLKKSSVAGKVPTVSDLNYGELAINYADGKIYYKNSSNQIKAFIDSAAVSTIAATGGGGGALSTSDVSEGTNLYYTSARVDSDIDGRVTQTFVNNLNVDADTVDGQEGSHYLDYNNFTNTPTIPTLGNDYVDSAQVSAIITADVDATFINALTIDADTLDGQAGSYYLNYNNLSNTPSIPTLGNDYVDSAQVSNIITADVDASFINALTIDADTLGGQSGSYYLNYNNFSNTPTIPTLGNDYVDSAQVSSIITADVDATFINALTIDADTLGSISASSFLRSDAADTKTSGDLSFSDNVKAIFGGGNDLQIYHDGSNSYLREGGTGDLKVLATNFVVKNLGDTINFITTNSSTGAMDLYHNGTSRLTTTSTGINVTGRIDADDAVYVEGSNPRIQVQDIDGTNQFSFLQQQGSDVFLRARNDTADGRIVFAGYGGSSTTNRLDITSGGDVRFWDETGAATKLVWDTSDEALEFGDNVKATFGASSDLQIYHDGSNSVIADFGAGLLDIKSDGAAIQLSSNTGELYAYFANNGPAQLFYDNSKKLETTSTGVDITGGLETTGDVIVGGDLQVTGTTTTINTEDLTVTDNMIYMNAGESSGSPTISVDVGWAGNVNDDGSYQHVGMFRDASDNTFKVFEGYTPEPDAAVEINIGHASFSLAPFAARTIEADSATINTSLLVNGADNNGGKADFAVATGGVPQISFRNDQVQIGNTDMNWVGRVYYSGGLQVGAWNSNVNIFNEGDTTSRDITFQPSYQGTRTERMIIKGETGRVGIGTSSPAYELDVRGSAADARIYLEDGASGAPIYMRSMGSGEAGLYIGTNISLTAQNGDFNTITNARDMTWSVDNGSTDHMFLSTGGDLGVGTSSPGTKLDVNGTVTATAVKIASTAQIEDFTNTTSSTSQATIASWSSSTFGGAKVLVEAKDGSNRHITELLITHDGTSATYTEYGSIWTSTALASYEVDISSGTVRLRVTPASSNSTSYKIMTTILYS